MSSTYYPRLVELDGKHPGETVDNPLDYTDWLVGAETLSTISSVTVGTGITLASSPAPAINGALVTFWLSGGSNGQTYTVRVIVTTSGGRTLVVDAVITVTDPTITAPTP
jgi:hypothetical protein